MSQKRKEIKKEFTIVGETSTMSSQVQESPQELGIPISFDVWWIQAQNKYKLSPNLRDSVKKHFEARGFMNYKTFNEGLRDFGFNV